MMYSGDEQDDMQQAQSRIPGVYVRENADPHELDMLWAGSKTYQREERSPLLFFAGGLILGIIATSAVFLLLMAKPDIRFGGGDKLVNPGVEEVEEAPVATKAETGKTVNTPGDIIKTKSTVGSQTYTVKDGDTLGGIAYRHYHSSAPEYVEKIRRANKVQGEMIHIGQELVIPPKNY